VTTWRSRAQPPDSWVMKKRNSASKSTVADSRYARPPRLVLLIHSDRPTGDHVQVVAHGEEQCMDGFDKYHAREGAVCSTRLAEPTKRHTLEWQAKHRRGDTAAPQTQARRHRVLCLQARASPAPSARSNLTTGTDGMTSGAGCRHPTAPHAGQTGQGASRAWRRRPRPLAICSSRICRRGAPC
jgi:hypothetical protein